MTNDSHKLDNKQTYICRGCGTLSTRDCSPYPDPCCPDNQYVTVWSYCEETEYRADRSQLIKDMINLINSLHAVASLDDEGIKAIVAKNVEFITQRALCSIN